MNESCVLQVCLSLNYEELISFPYKWRCFEMFCV